MTLEEALRDIQQDLFIGGQFTESPEQVAQCLYNLIDLILISRSDQ